MIDTLLVFVLLFVLTYGVVDALSLPRRRREERARLAEARDRRIRELEVDLFPEWYPTHAEYFGRSPRHAFNGPPPSRMFKRNDQWFALTDKPGQVIPFRGEPPVWVDALESVFEPRPKRSRFYRD